MGAPKEEALGDDKDDFGKEIKPSRSPVQAFSAERKSPTIALHEDNGQDEDEAAERTAN